MVKVDKREFLAVAAAVAAGPEDGEVVEIYGREFRYVVFDRTKHLFFRHREIEP